MKKTETNYTTYENTIDGISIQHRSDQHYMEYFSAGWKRIDIKTARAIMKFIEQLDKEEKRKEEG